MSPGTHFALSMLLTFGVPLALCLMPMRSSGDGPDRRKPALPNPVPPTEPEPLETTARQLPDCLIPRPELGMVEKTRELEPA